MLRESALITVSKQPGYNRWTVGQVAEVLKQVSNTAHCTLHTAHCTLHTTHCTLQVSELPVESRSALLELSPRPGGGALLLRIVANNGFRISARKFGVFLAISRINHSCWPNCLDSEGQVKVVRAVRRIKRGEELSLSYLSCNEGTGRMR